MSILGTRVVRNEDPLFLTRGAVYLDDLRDERLTGALHATFIRSSVAHGRVNSVDAEAALASPGVVAVITADDIAADLSPKRPGGPVNKAMLRPMLAGDTVRYVGEPVAVVLTEERYQAEDAAELVMVDIDPLPAVVSTDDATRDETLLFPDAGTNTAAASGEPPADDFFDGCQVVVSARITNQRLAASPLETRATAAAVGDDGRLTVWCSTQGAQQVHAEVAKRLGMDGDQVQLIAPDVGGGFGAKIGADPETIVVAWVARHLNRPVRWTETRSDNLVGMVHGRAQQQTITIGGRADGTVEAYSIGIDQDCGAYPVLGPMLSGLTMLMAPGVYAFPKVHAHARSIVTNTTPIGAYRGAGRPEATAAVERAMDMFAAKVGMDPAEVRRKNMLPAFAEPHTTATGATYDCGDYPAALEKLLTSADYEALRAEQKLRRERGDVEQLGLGLSVYVEITGAGEGTDEMTEESTVEVHADGSATVLTGTSPHGQGHATAWAMIVSDQTGIPVERVKVVHGDTDRIPKGGGTMGSRSLQQGGAAVHATTEQLVDVARQRAAEMLEANPDDLVVDVDAAGIAVRGTPGAGVSFAQLAAEQPLAATASFAAASPTYPFGAHLAVVAVDVESGKARVERLISVDDAGTVLNPLLVEGQRHGGIAQGVAQALLEEVLYDDEGNPQTSTLATYPFVSATELPSFELHEMATATPLNPLGAKGIGESGTIGSTPSVQNAIVDAVSHLGVTHIDMPATPMRVWRAIKDAQEGNA